MKTLSSIISSQTGRKGVATLDIVAENPHLIKYSAKASYWKKDGKRQYVLSFADRFGLLSNRFFNRADLLKGLSLELKHNNAYVNTGLNNSIDREFGSGTGGTVVGFIGVSSNNTAVTSATTFLNGASGGTATNTIIKAISPAGSRTNQTWTGGATFVNADFTSGVFIWNKIGLLTTSGDAGTGLVDVIGGSGGASPYNRTFALDLTSAGTFSVTAQIAVTAVAV